MTRTVTGLDLSLEAPGVARHQLGGDWYATTLTPPKLDKLDRLTWLLNSITEHCVATQLVVLEGPAYGAQGSSYHQLAGLWWLIRHELHRWGIPTAVVPPSNLKQFALGKGSGKGTGKDAVMLATARRFPDFEGDNNAADALWLCAMGADHLGEPLVSVPETYRAALAKIAWPEIGGAW